MTIYRHIDRPGPAQPITLFFALKPDRSTATRIHDLALRHRADRDLVGRPIAADRLHVTLMFFGHGVGPVPGEVGEAALSMGDAVKLAPFRVSFDRAASFAGKDNNRPYVLLGEDGVMDVMMLHCDLVGAALKVSDRERAFSRTKIHLTMLYDDRQLEAQAIEPISWTDREFVFIESWRGQTRHIERGKWSLAGLAVETAMTLA